MEINEWKRRLQGERREKNLFFAARLSLTCLLEFPGLAYWPLDPDYCFELELHEGRERKVVEMADGGARMRRWWLGGEFHFRLAGQQCALKAYPSDPRKKRFFVPFRDETAGKESCAASRYLDLDPKRHQMANGRWILDFNESYNPWCAYCEDYACPFVPPENWLKVPVRAGEKQYANLSANERTNTTPHPRSSQTYPLHCPQEKVLTNQGKLDYAGIY